jgi:hypothetical protein
MPTKLKNCPVCGLWHNGEGYAEGSKVLEINKITDNKVSDICPTHKPIYDMGLWFLLEVTPDFPARRLGRIALLNPDAIAKLFDHKLLDDKYNTCRILICNPSMLEELINQTNNKTQLNKEVKHYE